MENRMSADTSIKISIYMSISQAILPAVRTALLGNSLHGKCVYRVMSVRPMLEMSRNIVIAIHNVMMGIIIVLALAG